ncbi:MAG: hypothetical protein CMP11_07640 [Zetaproteobacteria bacterium]|nr:hypothetical protein [Pseudobdellovibrionaceae bacterium]
MYEEKSFLEKYKTLLLFVFLLKETSKFYMKEEKKRQIKSVFLTFYKKFFTSRNLKGVQQLLT